MWGRRGFVLISLCVGINSLVSIDLVSAQSIRKPLHVLTAEDRLPQLVGLDMVQHSAGFALAGIGIVAINVAPPWWYSWWAYLLYALLAVLLLRFYVRLRVQEALEKQERVNQQRDKKQRRNLPNRQRSYQDPLWTPLTHSEGTVPTDSAVLVNRQSPDPQNGQLPADPVPTSPFQQELQTLLENNFSNSRFGVEELAQAMGLSRVHLYRKIKAFSGLTASELIRHYRLTQATGLLRMGHTITETAYAVGFDSPAYFAKCFRDMYNLTPSDFQIQENGSHTSP